MIPSVFHLKGPISIQSELQHEKKKSYCDTSELSGVLIMFPLSSVMLGFESKNWGNDFSAGPSSGVFMSDINTETSELILNK